MERFRAEIPPTQGRGERSRKGKKDGTKRTPGKLVRGESKIHRKVGGQYPYVTGEFLGHVKTDKGI